MEGREEERREEEVSLPALETADGRLMEQWHAGVNEPKRISSTSASLVDSSSGVRSGGRGRDQCIDLTAAADEERTRRRQQGRQPLSSRPLNTSNAAGAHDPSPSTSAKDNTRRGRRSIADDKENSSAALQFINSVCDAVTASRRDQQRKRKSQRMKEQHEVIEVMSEPSADEEEADDEAAVTHIVRKPAAARRVRAAQWSDRSSSPSRPCVESVKNREVRASLPGYACPDCHAFHSVAHGERASHFETLCRHRYSQSAISSRHLPHTRMSRWPLQDRLCVTLWSTDTTNLCLPLVVVLMSVLLLRRRSIFGTLLHHPTQETRQTRTDEWHCITVSRESFQPSPQLTETRIV